MASRGLQLIAFCLAIAVAYARAPSKIVNGQNALSGEFPYQVSLQLYGRQFCGGSIIDATHILTAAHCIAQKDGSLRSPAGMEVVTGSLDIEGGTPSNTFQVTTIIAHEGYIPHLTGSMVNDIALLKLSRPIPFNAYQKPIKLPARDTPAGTPVVASGWGASEWRGEQSQGMPKLQKLQMKTLSVQDCKSKLGADITPNQICVFASANSGVCVGDSGGPIAHNGELLGITSFGIPCAIGYPDVYTRVFKYISWIQNAMRY